MRKADNKRATKKRQPTIPLPRPLLAHMRRWQRNGQRFAVEFNGRPVERIDKAFRQLVKDCGLERVGWCHRACRRCSRCMVTTILTTSGMRRRRWEGRESAAIRGDEAAYAEFLRLAAELVRGLARRKLASDRVVSPEDIMHEVLLAIHINRHTSSSRTDVRRSQRNVRTSFRIASLVPGSVCVAPSPHPADLRTEIPLGLA